MPELVIQFSDIRQNPPTCLHGDELTQVVEKIRTLVNAVFGGACDIRTRCHNSRVTTIGIWRGLPRDDEESSRRDATFAHIDELPGGMSFGLFLSAFLLDLTAQNTFASTSFAKRYDDKGVPDPHGPIHLTAIRVELHPTDKIVTRIRGYDSRPVPDVYFWATITDTVDKACILPTLPAGCSKFNVRPDRDDIAEAIVALLVEAVGFAVSTFAQQWWLAGGFAEALAATLGFDIAALHGSQAAPAGVGAQIDQALPQAVILPAQKKITFSYLNDSMVRVDPQHADRDGVIITGLNGFADTKPIVAIGGPGHLQTLVGHDVTGTFTATPSEMLGRVHYTWSGEGAISDPTGSKTDIKFSVAGVPAGTTVTKRIRVEARDEDIPPAQPYSRTADITIKVVGHSG